MRLWAQAVRNAATLCGKGSDPLLVVRWIYLIIFAGIITEGRALIGPSGIAPAADYCAAIARMIPNPVERAFLVPSLLWFDAGGAAISGWAWTGLGAALAVTLNVWPRLTLFSCWVIFLSFVSTWQLATSSIVDQLMLEVALLAIPFAPAGIWPGMGSASPPRPVAVFAMRWLLLRLMLTSGLIKFTGEDPHWRSFTAMEVMYQTSPMPTYLGYLAHHMPRWFQSFEIGLTFGAEIAAPVLALFGGRRGRWLAFFAWMALQAGIQLTGSFGWLNTASMALGILLLDDSMISSAAGRIGLGKLVMPPLTPNAGTRLTAHPNWRRYGLRVFLGLQFLVALYYSGLVFASPRLMELLAPVTRAMDLAFREFNSANAYVPYGAFPSAKYEVEFLGSNDGGRSWRSYHFKFKPQSVDRICGFVAPRLPRFETSLQLIVRLPQCPLVPRVAVLLLSGNPDVMRLFEGDPFPDRPPNVIQMPVYKFTFTSLKTMKETGAYWAKEYEGDYMPPVYLRPDGRIVE